MAIDAIRAQGHRAILLRGWAELALSDDCIAGGDINQQRPCSAKWRPSCIMAGAGTTTTAARAGAPQGGVPQIVDQPYWAGRVAELGIGAAAHDGPAPTSESLSAALRTALSAETRARATAMAGKIRTDGVTVAAQLLSDAVHRQISSAAPELSER